jgi:hypothetical protein
MELEEMKLNRICFQIYVILRLPDTPTGALWRI